MDVYGFLGITAEYFEHMQTCENGCGRSYDWEFDECDWWLIHSGKRTQKSLDKERAKQERQRARDLERQKTHPHEFASTSSLFHIPDMPIFQ